MPNRKPPPERFPPPWRIEMLEESVKVTDALNQTIAFVYFAEAPQRRTVTGRMSPDAARRIATAIARLPELLAMEKHALSGEMMPVHGTTPDPED